MNSRSNFQRLQQWQLADRQRYLTELEALGDKLRADVEHLGMEIDQLGGVELVPTRARADPRFMRPLIDRREKLLRSITEIDEQIVEARAAVTSVQQETRLFEDTLVHRSLRFEERLTRRTRRSI
jgi:hypothetical protein